MSAPDAMDVLGFAEQMRRRLPATMRLPAEFGDLFGWIERNGFFMPSERFPGDRLGLLNPVESIEQGTVILFRVETCEQAQESGHGWLGGKVPDIADRLVSFARTGGDGSHAAFWIDDQGHQQIVHLGAGGALGILTSTPLDFLRLLGTGYQEISGDCLEAPDQPPDDEDGERIVVNQGYRSWLARRYGVTLPRTASEVIGAIFSRRPSLDTVSDDPFWNWVRRHQGW